MKKRALKLAPTQKNCPTSLHHAVFRHTVVVVHAPASSPSTSTAAQHPKPTSTLHPASDVIGPLPTHTRQNRTDGENHQSGFFLVVVVLPFSREASQRRTDGLKRFKAVRCSSSRSRWVAARAAFQDQGRSGHRRENHQRASKVVISQTVAAPARN